jgi:glycosyltransferase involved in cell wall biosynthesis
MTAPKIAIVVSHPIQHFCPQYASIAKKNNVRLKVFFASTLGYKKYMDPNFKTEISWDNLRLDEFDHTFLNGEKGIAADWKIDAPSLNAALSEYRPDLVIVYGYFQKLQRRAFRWSRSHGIRLAYISDSELRQKRTWSNTLLKHMFLGSYFTRIDYFLSVGDANEEFYLHYGVPPKKIVRMHFPIDVLQYRKSYEIREQLSQRIRKQYEIDADATVLLVVGKLVPWKNQDDIIFALQLLESRNIYMHLFVAGTGEMMEKCKEKALGLRQSKVYFPGFVKIDELPAYYAAADIYIHPAEIEPHSLAISEAIYMGRPAVISDKCGSYGDNDDVQDSKNGYVYKFGRIHELAELIYRLAMDKARRDRFGAYSHQIATRFQEISHSGCIDMLVEKMHPRP